MWAVYVVISWSCVYGFLRQTLIWFVVKDFVDFMLQILKTIEDLFVPTITYIVIAAFEWFVWVAKYNFKLCVWFSIIDFCINSMWTPWFYQYRTNWFPRTDLSVVCVTHGFIIWLRGFQRLSCTCMWIMSYIKNFQDFDRSVYCLHHHYDCLNVWNV